MATQSVQTLKAIRRQLNDLSVSDQQAQGLTQLLEQSLALLDEFSHSDHAFFENRRKAAREGLAQELKRYEWAYWGQNEKIEKINRFNLARQEAHHLLGKVLSACN